MTEEIVSVYEAALAALRAGVPIALATVVEVTGSAPRRSAKMAVYADGRIVGTVGGGDVEARVIADARQAIADSASREVTYRPQEVDGARCGGDTMRVWIEVLAPPATLLIIGGGHVGQAVAELGASLGYRIVVMDERPEMVTAERFPWAGERLTGEIPHLLAQFPPTSPLYVVILTPHHSRDEEILVALADRAMTSAQDSMAYVGLMGGRSRTARTFARAREAGVPEEWLARVHTPVGLDIGAETPKEIAVSILAEVIAVQHQRVP